VLLAVGGWPPEGILRDTWLADVKRRGDCEKGGRKKVELAIIVYDGDP